MADNGNGTRERIVQWVPTGVIVLAVSLFGLWWNATDPRARMEKIEEIQRENRKELIESIARLRSDVDKEYVSLREYQELQHRVNVSVSKAEFESWMRERDLYLKNFLEKYDKK